METAYVTNMPADIISKHNTNWKFEIITFKFDWFSVILYHLYIDGLVLDCSISSA